MSEMTGTHRRAAPARGRRPGSVRFLAALVCAVASLLSACAPATEAGVIAEAVRDIHDEARGVPDDRRRAHEDRDIVVLQWAAELDLAESFSERELRQEYDAAGGAQSDDGRPYGVLELSFWDYYRERVAQVEELVRSHVRDSLSMEDARAYHDANPDEFARQDTIVVDVVPWSDGRAGQPWELTIDERSVRALQEQHDELVAAALVLDEGDQVVVDLRDGSQVQVMCRERTDGGTHPFDDVVQAALSQLATQEMGAEIERRLASIPR